MTLGDRSINAFQIEIVKKNPQSFFRKSTIEKQYTVHCTLYSKKNLIHPESDKCL